MLKGTVELVLEWFSAEGMGDGYSRETGDVIVEKQNGPPGKWGALWQPRSMQYGKSGLQREL